MIVIYTQDNTIIRNDVDSAREDLIYLYGEKLGNEAYTVVKNGRIGTSYRKYGGPLVKVITKEEAEFVETKEQLVNSL